MTTLVLTDNPRSNAMLRRAFGDDITVREIPLPLFRLPKSDICLTVNGTVKLDPVTKHIAELRKLASRFSLVLVVAPPVSFWYEIGWSIHRALAGLSVQVLFYFPCDLANGLSVEPSTKPPPSMSNVGYACDALVERGISSIYAEYDVRVPRPAVRRSVSCVLAVLARMYEVRSPASRPAYSIIGPRQYVLRTDSSMIHTADLVPSITTYDAMVESVTPDTLLQPSSLASSILSSIPVSPIDIGKALDTLYSLGCISHPEVSSPVPDAVHSWAVSSLLDDYAVDPSFLSLGPGAPCVYATGLPLPLGVSDSVASIHAFIVRRTLLYYCATFDCPVVRSAYRLDGDSLAEPLFATYRSIDTTSPSLPNGTWLSLVDWADALEPVLDLSHTSFRVDFQPHYAVRASLLFDTAVSLGLSPREVLSAFYYLSQIEAIHVTVSSSSFGLSTYGFLLYTLLSKASSAFTTPDLFSLNARATVAALDETASLLEEADSIFRGAVVPPMSEALSLPIGFEFDNVLLTLKSGDAAYGVVLADGAIVPFPVPSTIKALCPSCGAVDFTASLGPKFTTVCKCSSSDCTEQHHPISLVPLTTKEMQNGTTN